MDNTKICVYCGIEYDACEAICPNCGTMNT